LPAKSTTSHDLNETDGVVSPMLPI